MKKSTLYYQKYHLKGLDDFVKYAWIMQSTGVQSSPDLLIPDGYTELIFVKKGGYYKQFLNTEKTSITIQKSCLVGIQTQSVLASRMEDTYLIGLKLKPKGAYFLFKKYLNQLLDTNHYLEYFGVEWLSNLDKKLQNYSDETDIISCLEETLLLQIGKGIEDKNNLSNAFLEAILKEKGQISVQALAETHHLSIRQFQRKFKTFFGLSPKKFLNIIRFKNLYKSSILQEKLPDDFLSYGYYDQMHFIKDFQKNLGVSPSKSRIDEFVEMNKMAKWNL